MQRTRYPARLGLSALPPLLAGVVMACGSPPSEGPLEIETVDVGLPIDAELSTEGDVQAAERAAAVSGLVPGDVPPDLPLFAPSSVVDFSDPAAGPAWVELDAGKPPAVVQRWLAERLPAAGWTVVAIGDDLVEADKGGRRVAYRLTDLAPGTRIRLEYAARP